VGWSELIGERLGDYEIVSEIARGGMSRVYRAHDLAHDRDIAIKVMAVGSDGSDMTNFAHRFRHEAQAVELLDHPNIVKVFDAGQSDEFVYMIMQLVEGGTFRTVLQPGKPMPIADACSYIIQMARALHHAHMHHVIHRDVKPANMLIDASDRSHMLLADFGIAKIIGQKGVTKTGTAVGTPEYMAPEQAKGEEIDPRADIYGLACVLYEALAGRPPFVGPTALSICYQHVHTRPAYIRGFNTEVSRQLALVVEQALAKNPRDRYPTAEAFATALYPFTEPAGAIRRTGPLMPAAELDLRVTPNDSEAHRDLREPVMIPSSPLLMPFDEENNDHRSFAGPPVLDLSSLSIKPPMVPPMPIADETTKQTQELLPIAEPARPRHTRPVQPGLRLKSRPVTSPRIDSAPFGSAPSDPASFSTIMTPATPYGSAINDSAVHPPKSARVPISELEPRRRPLFILLSTAIVCSVIALLLISRAHMNNAPTTTPIARSNATATAIPTVVPTTIPTVVPTTIVATDTPPPNTIVPTTPPVVGAIRSATVTFGLDSTCDPTKNTAHFPAGTSTVFMNVCGVTNYQTGYISINLSRSNGQQIFVWNQTYLPFSPHYDALSTGSYDVTILWNNQKVKTISFTIG